MIHKHQFKLKKKCDCKVCSVCDVHKRKDGRTVEKCFKCGYDKNKLYVAYEHESDYCYCGESCGGGHCYASVLGIFRTEKLAKKHYPRASIHTFSREDIVE